MSEKLPDFLRHAASRKFVTWEFDCCYWLADWYVFATGVPDPAAYLRNNPPQIGPLGIARVVQRIADGCGLRRTTSPRPGDIGLLRARPGTEVVGAIKTTKGWAVLTQGGGISRSMPDLMPNVRVMAAWSVSSG